MNSTYAFNSNEQFPNVYSFTSKTKSSKIGMKYSGLGENYKARSINVRYRNINGDVEYYIKKDKFNEGDKMDNEKILEMYINKVDKDQSELKQDVRESEKRIEDHIVASEKRMDERLNKIEILINSQNDKMESLKEEVRNKLTDDKKYRHTNNIAIVLGVIATVIAMIGIYYATVSTITDIISLGAK